MAKRLTNHDAIDLIASHKAFTINSISAECDTYVSRGKYNGDDVPTDKVRYVVYSYWTPIAWVTGAGEVVIPAQKYSVTTTKHQGLLYLLKSDPIG